MKLFVAAFVLVASTSIAHAQTPAAPQGATGMCNDGTYSNAPSKRGACAGHKGVKDWYAAGTTAAAAPAAPAATPAPPAAKAGAPVPASSPAATTATPAAGGGAGKVWVNTASKVYHCQGTKYYGTTKAGEYMTEAAAKQAGARPDHGKACS